MPYYDYFCRNCDSHHEIKHSIKDNSPKYCPNCNSEVKRWFGKSIIDLRGGGWGASGYTKTPTPAPPKEGD
jgi:putative FmdB family regulatory protein